MPQVSRRFRASLSAAASAAGFSVTSRPIARQHCRRFGLFFCYSVCCRRFGHFSSGCPTTLSAFRTFLSAIALLQALRSLFVRLSDGIVGFVIYRHFYAQHPPRLRFNDLETQIGKIKFIAGAGIPPSFSSAKPPTVL